jgi:hypothetical protein
VPQDAAPVPQDAAPDGARAAPRALPSPVPGADPGRRAARAPDRPGSARRGGRPAGWVAAAALAAALAPTVGSAHAKWFVDTSRYPLRTDLILSDRTLILVVAAVLGLAVLYGLQRLLGPHWPEAPFLRRMAVGAPTLLAVQAAIGLVAAAAEPALFAPNLALPVDALGLFLAAVQIGVALTFITGIGDWLGAIVLILLGPIGFLLFPPFDVLDVIHFAGIGAAILVIGRTAVDAGHVRPWFARRGPAWPARAIAALRILSGLAILAPALSEKVWNPDLGAAFLAQYPHFNLPRTLLGLEWFTDDLFVLSVGVIEGTIGVLLASGLLTRVVIVGMYVPFHLGVPFLPAAEYLGHIPIFAIMYVLLVHSRGSLTTREPPRAVLRQPA